MRIILFSKNVEFLNFKKKKLYINRNEWLDNFDISFDELQNMPINDSKRIFYRWLKEKGLYHLYMRDNENVKINTVYDFFKICRKKNEYWNNVEFAFFYSFKFS